MNTKQTATPSFAVVETWLRTQLAKLLALPQDNIDIDCTFASYGVASIEGIKLISELEQMLGTSLSPTLVWEYPTIAALAHFLADDNVSAPALAQTVSATVTHAAESELIAIVGLGCRYPGAENVAALWRLLCQGGEAISEIPPDRWDIEAYYHPDRAAPGKMTTRWGGFLPHLDQFDAHFFGISPREAPHVDPRQRLMLEVAWEALEDAGIPPDSLAGSRTGVFVATLSNDYDQLLAEKPASTDAYTGPGTANSIVANRISYWLDLRGPSMALDTACSGSLVAIHLACQGLQRGEMTLALVGGVNLNLLPKSNIFFTKAGALASDGRCKTFDARADGIVRSDGAGMIVLKPLAQAQADGDPIYAVIRGSAINHDGHSNGIMAPNGQAQQQLLREAYRQARVSPGQIQYIEAHGTGTSLGDPIEVKALGEVLTENRHPDHKCALGSIKTNIGHSEAAAGIAGIIKTALSIKHRVLPASLHFEQPNPLIPFDTLPFTVQQTLGPWPSPAELLLAGVSGFGFGGTNAHVVLQEAPPTAAPAAPSAAQRAYLVPLSARTPEALRALAQAYQQQVSAEEAHLTSAERLANLGYTASLRRSHHSHRLALVAQSPAELVEQLAAYLRDEPPAGAAQAAATTANQRGKLAFIFSGQGSHWLGMGRELAEKEPVFRATLARCDELLGWYVDWSLLAELAANEADSRLNQTDVTQPAIFAIQAALADLWRSWGVTPDVVVGHSLGEVAAAYAAGVLTLEEAIQVVFQRSRLMKTVAGQGKTAVVGLPLEQAQLALGGYADRLAVAGSNSPTTSVLSGDPVALEQVLDALEKQQIFCRLLAGVDVAFHSPQMEPLRHELVDALAGLAPRAANIPIFSTVTGDAADGAMFDADYWGKNLRNPFLFTTVMQKLLALGYDTFLEVSPHPVLASAILQNIQHEQGERTDAGRRPAACVLSSLRRHEAQQSALLTALGVLYTKKQTIEWRKLYPATAHHVALPTYPWQRTHYWLDQLAGDSRTSRKPGTHPLLGEYLEPANHAEARFWETDLSAYTTAYLSDHRALGAVIMPGAAYVEMALAASRQAFNSRQLTIHELTFEQALRLPTEGTTRVQVILAPEAAGESSFQVYSRSAASGDPATAWTRHASGQLAATLSGTADVSALTALSELKTRCTEEIPGATHYATMAAHGLHYGPSFQPIQQIWRGTGEALSQIALSQPLASESTLYQVHPILLDAGFQTVAATLAATTEDGTTDAIYLPHSVASLHFYQPPDAQVWCHAQLRSDVSAGRDADRLEADLTLFNADGAVAVIVQGLRLQRLNANQPRKPKTPAELLYTLQWQAQPLDSQVRRLAAEAGAPSQPGHWLILADSQGVGAALATRLTLRGEICTLIHPDNAEAWLEEARPDGVNPAQPDARHRMLQTVLTDTAYRGIVHLWGLDTPATADLTTERLERAQALGCATVLQIIQTLAATNRQPRLWLITQHTQTVDAQDGPAAIAQAPLWGMGRVIALEHPELWGGLVDLDRSDPTAAATLLSEELWSTSGETQVAFRNGERYVARLRHCTDSAALGGNSMRQPLKLRADGSYLITGGLSGLGLLIARWMVQQGARRLILVGRSELPARSTWRTLADTDPAAERVAAMRALESLGASVHYAALDVADETQLSDYLTHYRQEGYPPLRGVVHSAGVLNDQLLLRMDQAALHQVMRPKLNGAWALHQTTAAEPLDFFVLFSSASALLGQFGQANYAAGNAFMDALAHARQAQGLPALSINWGPWAEVGMFARLDPAAQAVRTGVTALVPQQGLQVLAQLLTAKAPQVAVIDANWQRLPPVPLLAELAMLANDEPLPAADRAEADSSLLLELLLAEPAARIALLETELRTAAARVFKLAPAQLDIQAALPELGMDSIMAVELKNQIETTLGVTVSMVEMFTSSVADLVNKLNAQLQGDDQLATLLTEMEELSLDQMDRLLVPA